MKYRAGAGEAYNSFFCLSLSSHRIISTHLSSKPLLLLLLLQLLLTMMCYVGFFAADPAVGAAAVLLMMMLSSHKIVATHLSSKVPMLLTVFG